MQEPRDFAPRCMWIPVPRIIAIAPSYFVVAERVSVAEHRLHLYKIIL